MDSSIYVSTAAQRSLGRQLEVIANNIANANTVGFRSEQVDFASIVVHARQSDTHFPHVADLSANIADGARIETGSKFDVAISGPAWLAINTPAGMAYTRDGRLSLTPLGELVNVEGYPVLDSAGAPISLGQTSGTDIEITTDGRLVTNGLQVADLGLFKLEPQEISKRYGSVAFMTDRQAAPAVPGVDATIHQGFVENSNTNLMQEMANLITVTRLFEASSTAIEKADQTVARASQELSLRR